MFNTIAGDQINIVDQRMYINIQITPLSVVLALAIIVALR